MRYITNDGERFAAETPKAFVKELRAASYSKSGSDSEFMKEMAARARLMDENWNVPTDSIESFVNGLIEIGFVKPDGEESA